MFVRKVAALATILSALGEVLAVTRLAKPLSWSQSSLAAAGRRVLEMLCTLVGGIYAEDISGETRHFIFRLRSLFARGLLGHFAVPEIAVEAASELRQGSCASEPDGVDVRCPGG